MIVNRLLGRVVSAGILLLLAGTALVWVPDHRGSGDPTPVPEVRREDPPPPNLNSYEKVRDFCRWKISDPAAPQQGFQEEALPLALLPEEPTVWDEPDEISGCLCHGCICPLSAGQDGNHGALHWCVFERAESFFRCRPEAARRRW